MSDAGMRVDRDSLGEVKVAQGVYWGAQTERARQHFAFAEPMPQEVLRALVLIKKVCAAVNVEYGNLTAGQGMAITAACDEILAGRLDGQFPLSVWQSGSGTQTNMNVNEVVARRAEEILAAIGQAETIHPNDHVNRSQSTNDIFPTAMHLAALDVWELALRPALTACEEMLRSRAADCRDVVKIGRTHLQDAVPLTVGAEISAWASLVSRNRERIDAAAAGLCDLAVGGTAVGSGINAPPGFGAAVAARLAAATGWPLRPHPNPYAALSAHDEIVAFHHALETLAGSFFKIASDIRLLASGPRCGLGELLLPENEPGSSIMPGKVNPTQCEVLTMICAAVHGNGAAIAFAGSQGTLQLNVYKPLLIRNLLSSLQLLADGCSSFTRHLLRGLDINRERIARHLDASLMLVTLLVPVLGYDRAAAAARLARSENLSLRDACLKLELLDGPSFDALIRAGLAASAGGPD